MSANRHADIELLNEPTLAYESLVDFYAQAAPVVAVANSSGINITISGEHSTNRTRLLHTY